MASNDAAAANLRIVLVGKTGAGKSATGNTKASSVTSVCQKKGGEFGSQTLAVIDTPGLFDTTKSREFIYREICRCVALAAPGPHVFLIVIQPNRFTEEERQTVKIIQEVFGEAASHYTMALFTRGDDLKHDKVTIEEFIKGNPSLSEFISQCKGGYHLFNNREEDPSQVKELLKKINNLVQRNGGKHYTNEMLREAEEALLQMMRELLERNLGMIKEEARREAEYKFEWEIAPGAVFILKGNTESLGGPLGTVAGVAAGISVRALPATIRSQDCTIQ